jgi:V/A-type H+/Na+-transporting ATPase subunit F
MLENVKVCILGERDIILIFKAFSFKTIPVDNKIVFNEKLKEEILSKKNKIIIITETFIVQIDEDNKSLIKELKPILVSIPTNKGSKEVALNDLSSLIKKAIGIDLLSVGGDNTNE